MMNRFLILLLCLAAMSTGVLAQRAITGTVTDSQYEPLIGVNIVIKGTTNGTITDLDGNFEIEVPSNETVLVFSYTGYAPQEILVGAQSVINLQMEEAAELLDEVVVSALGFSQKKDEMGSTYSTIDADDVVRAGDATMINSLSGRAAGVRIARSNGDPGAGSTIQIRGANTITGSSDPLIILDGVPISNSTLYGGGNDGRDAGTSQQSRLNDLNPNDIESIQVLKGASAASLWGSRAANGVIVITTKKGKSGKPTITFSSGYSLDQVNTRHELQDQWGQGSRGAYSPTASTSWGDKIADRSGGADEVRTDRDYFIAADGDIYYPITQKNSRETFVDENFDQVFQTGKIWQNDLTISGGSDKSTFFFSLGHLDQDGIIKNSYYNRTNIRLNNQTIFTNWLSMNTRAAYINSSANRIQQSSNVSGLYLGLMRNPPDFDIEDYIGTYVSRSGQEFANAHRAYRRYLAGNGTTVAPPAYNNPLWTTNEQESTTKVDRYLINMDLNIDPTSWLKFTLRGGVDSYSDRRDYFFPKNTAGSANNNGRFNEDVINEREINFDAIAKGTFSLGPNIDLLATLGWNINDRTRQWNYAVIQGFLVDVRLHTTDVNTSNDASSITNGKRYIRSNRGYGVLSFDLFKQLFVNLSGALEAASSVDGSFFYPSADLAWQFTKLPGLSGSKALTFGKLRGSFGQVGVQPQPHRAQTLAEGGFSYSTYSDPLDINLFGGGFRVDDDKGNPALKPEIKTEWEIGADLRFFRDRLGLAVTYYQNEIKDILFDVSTAPSTGFNNIYDNAGRMENKGLELELDYDIIRKKDFTLGVYANFNRNRNKVTDLKGVESVDLTTQSISSRAVVGYPLGVLWSNRVPRDANGNFVLTEFGFPVPASEQGVVGDPNPDWRGGAGVRGFFKGLSFNVLFEHSQGGDFAERTRFIMRNFGTHADVGNEVTLTEDLRNVNGELIPAGTTVRGNIDDFGAGPVLLDEAWYTGRGAGFGDGVINELAINTNTWTRLREVAIGYTLSTAGFRKTTRLDNIYFGLTGRNLFLWTDIKGIDPETNQFGVTNGFGIDYFTNPGTRTIMFNIRITY